MFITLLAQQKIHPAIMQRLARHSTSAVTLGVYTHANIDDERAAIGALDCKFENKIRPCFVPVSDFSQNTEGKNSY